jgi:AcrR family transcriptional regulator
MNRTGNPALTSLIARIDQQHSQERLLAAYALEERAENELEQLEQSIADLSGCAPGAAFAVTEPTVHAQFDLSDEIGGSTSDFIAPLLANRRRLQAELESCRAQTKQVENASEVAATQQRRSAVQRLLEYWVFEEINQGRRNGDTMVPIDLDGYDEEVVTLLHLVLTENRRLGCWLEDGQLTITF